MFSPQVIQFFEFASEDLLTNGMIQGCIQYGVQGEKMELEQDPEWKKTGDFKIDLMMA